jgi:hypothetical protein
VQLGRRVRPSTIGRRVAAIRYAHKLAGLLLPTDDERVRATVRGIRRSLDAAPSKKMPATAERVIGMRRSRGRDCLPLATAPCCSLALPAPSVALNWSR